MRPSTAIPLDPFFTRSFENGTGAGQATERGRARQRVSDLEGRLCANTSQIGRGPVTCSPFPRFTPANAFPRVLALVRFWGVRAIVSP